jgi:hypothetical protein
VLRPGGHYFSQQIGAGTNRELIEFMMGPVRINPAREPGRAVAAAEGPFVAHARRFLIEARKP